LVGLRQVLQSASGATFVRDVPPPACPPGHVLVRNAFSAVSSGTERSRVAAAQRSLVSRVVERPELALKVVERARQDGLRATHDLLRRSQGEETATGYSSAGTVIELGAAARGLAVGDRVACAGAGYANHAEVVSVPRNLCARVPPGVPLEAAALTTIAAIALHAVRLADVRLGDRVAVVGCGLVGQIAVRLLAAAGAVVLAFDLDPGRVEAARAGGAERGFLVGEGTRAAATAAAGGDGVDQALVCAAAPTSDPLVLAAGLVRDRGAVVLVGDVPVEAPRSLFFAKELSFRVSRSYGPGRYDADYEERGLDYPIGYVRWTEQRNMACVLDLQARGSLALGDLIDEVVPVARAEEVYARLAGPPAGRPSGAFVFSYDGAEPVAAEPPVRPDASLARVDGPVRIGLIGPGGFARGVLVPALRASGARLELVAGGSGPAAAAEVRSGEFARVAAGAAELIADDGIDAVVVATRHGSHAALAAAALEAGRHVFCEKPLALDAEELGAVLAAARRAERVLAVGFNRRFAPQAERMREFLADRSDPLAVVYRVSAGQVEPGHWVHDLSEGGGRLIGEGCHFLDTLVFLTGSRIRRVSATGFGRPGQPLAATDNALITLAFADRSVASLVYVAEGGTRLAKERIEAFADGRTAVLEDFRTLELYDDAKPRSERLRAQDKGHAAEVEAFLAGVRAGRHPIPLEVLANVHVAAFAVIESLRTGQPVAVAE
jgi:predicted dehydrogenase